MTGRDRGRRLVRHAGRIIDRAAAAAEWAAALAARRVPPRAAVTALVASTVVTTTTLTLIAAAPLPGRVHRLAGDAARAMVAADPTPAHPAPTHQPPRPVAARPAASPAPGTLRQPAGEFVGWAIMDLTDGSITGENLTEVSTTASMIKAWIVADFLRLEAEAGRTPGELRMRQLEQIIRDSNNEYAEAIFQQLGAHESIERLIQICRLTDSSPYLDFWSNTQLSPRDTARMGACIADGRAAGPVWTGWLLDEMRAVRGAGDFGIRHAFPEEIRPTIAIKNGWIDRTYDGNWHVNCLAIGDTWSMGVLTRYPVHLGYQHGAEICRTLAAEHLTPLQH
ncbi:MAG TPA: hypothetical protein VKZ74_05955 [Natronosporangium sp.]|nr:hypothetical protein [Natronosporangium sp.]